MSKEAGSAETPAFAASRRQAHHDITFMSGPIDRRFLSGAANDSGVVLVRIGHAENAQTAMSLSSDGNLVIHGRKVCTRRDLYLAFRALVQACAPIIAPDGEILFETGAEGRFILRERDSEILRLEGKSLSGDGVYVNGVAPENDAQIESALSHFIELCGLQAEKSVLMDRLLPGSGGKIE